MGMREKLTSNAVLFDGVQDSWNLVSGTASTMEQNNVTRTLRVNAFLKIILSPFAKFVILNCDLSNELVVVFELLPGINIIIIEFHPRSARIAGRTQAERRHAPSVHIQGAIREEEQEQAVGRFLRVCEMLTPVVMVDDAVEGGRVQLGERRVCVLAMEAFLVAIDHRFPIEFA